MPKKKKESWKEKRRHAALKRERALEAERIRRERETKEKTEGATEVAAWEEENGGHVFVPINQTEVDKSLYLHLSITFVLQAD